MYNESNWLCNYLDGCRKYTNEILHLDYVKDTKEVMFNSTKTERENIRARYSAKVPDALTNQIPDRRKKEEAIIHHAERKQARTELFPAGIFMQLYIIATMMVNTVIKSMFVTSMAENYIALIHMFKVGKHIRINNLFLLQLQTKLDYIKSSWLYQTLLGQQQREKQDIVRNVISQ